MVDTVDHAEEMRQRLAREFYKLLKAEEHQKLVRVDFSQLPRSYNFAIPHPFTIVNDKDPVMINSLDLIANTLPGLWRYAENADLERYENCTRCGKMFDIRTRLEVKD